MKNSQLLQAWSMRSVTHGDGRRLITVWRGEEPCGPRGATAAGRLAGRAPKGQPIGVKFAEEASFAFSPAIRRGNAAPALVPPSVANVQHSETL